MQKKNFREQLKKVLISSIARLLMFFNEILLITEGC